MRKILKENNYLLVGWGGGGGGGVTVLCLFFSAPCVAVIGKISANCFNTEPAWSFAHHPCAGQRVLQVNGQTDDSLSALMRE